jgi:hypothetical protein
MPYDSNTLAAAPVADDWYATFHSGLAAEFWRAAAATMADARAARPPCDGDRHQRRGDRARARARTP